MPLSAFVTSVPSPTNTMKTIAPNTQLPKGAKLLKKPLTHSIGGWSEMELDAVVERQGIKWFRVKGGMGDGGDREDWIANIPSGCLSVHDYQWREPRWGFEKFNSFNEAVTAQIKRGIDFAKKKAVEYRQNADNADQTVQLLERALRK